MYILFLFYVQINHLYLVTWLQLSINLSLKKKKNLAAASNTQFKLHSSLTAKLLSCQFWWLWLKYYLSREHLPPDALTTHASCFSCLFDNDFQCCCFCISVAISFFFFPTISWQFLDQGLTFWLCWNKFQDPKWNHCHQVSQLNFHVTVNDQQCNRSSQPFSRCHHLWALYLFICPLIFLYYQIHNLRHSCSVFVLPLWILYKSHSGPKSLREFHWGIVYPNPWIIFP